MSARSKKILDILKKGPAVSALDDSQGGGAVALLNLNPDGELLIDYTLGWEGNGILAGTNFLAVFEGGFARINCGDGHSVKSVSQQFRDYPIQKNLDYRYVLLSRIKSMVITDKYSRLIVAFPMFFIDYSPDESRLDALRNKNYRVKVGFSSSETWRRFPYKHETVADTVWIEIVFNKYLDIKEVVYFREIIIEYVTSKVGQPIPADETLLSKNTTKTVDEYNNYALYLPSRTPIPSDKPQSSLNEDRLLDFKNRKEFITDLNSYISRFEDMQPGVHLHAAYIKYREEKAYIDTQLTFLFAGIDAMYSCIFQPDIDIERGKAYDDFLSAIKSRDIKLSKSLRNFINRGKEAYQNDQTYEYKLIKVTEYSGLFATRKWINKVAKLRNSIAHGKSINWSEYLYNYVDDEGERIDKVDPDKLANILWTTIIRFSRTKSWVL
jgi:hypothetical protein